MMCQVFRKITKRQWFPPFETLQRGGSLITVLILISISIVSYVVTEQFVLKSKTVQKQIFLDLVQDDLAKQVGSICSSIYSINQMNDPKKSENKKYSNSDLISCMKGGGSCTASKVDSNPSSPSHVGLPLQLFDLNEEMRLVGSTDCPTYFSEYGAPNNVGSDFHRCQRKKGDAFVVRGSVRTVCHDNKATCSVAKELISKCTVAKVIDDKESTAVLVLNNQIGGMSCKDKVGGDEYAVTGIDGNGQFVCSPMVAVVGYKGDKGKDGLAIKGPPGPPGQKFATDRPEEGCFSGDTKIMTNHGEKNILDLSDDDLIFNPITKKYYAMNRSIAGPEKDPMVNVVLDDGKKIQITKYHPMMTLQGVKAAMHLQKGMQIKLVDQYMPIANVYLSDEKNAKVYNFDLVTTGNDEDHFVLANGMISGDLLIQERLQRDLKFNQQLSLAIFSEVQP